MVRRSGGLVAFKRSHIPGSVGARNTPLGKKGMLTPERDVAMLQLGMSVRGIART